MRDNARRYSGGLYGPTVGLSWHTGQTGWADGGPGGPIDNRLSLVGIAIDMQ